MPHQTTTLDLITELIARLDNGDYQHFKKEFDRLSGIIAMDWVANDKKWHDEQGAT